MFLSISRLHCFPPTPLETPSLANPVLISCNLSVACRRTAGYSSMKSLQNNTLSTALVPDGVLGGQGECRWARQPWPLPTWCLLFSEEFKEKRQLQKTKPSSLQWHDFTQFRFDLPSQSLPHHIVCWMLILYVKYYCHSGFPPRPSFCSVGDLILVRCRPPSMCLWCQFSWSVNPPDSSVLGISTWGSLWHLKPACAKPHLRALIALL